MVPIRFGVELSNYGPSADRESLQRTASACERLGYQSLWLSDHLVMPHHCDSHYPFSDSGTIENWSPTDAWYEPVACMPLLLEATSTIEVGTAVLLAGLRQPIVLAKQLATIDALYGGRVALGIGAGWMREEIEALNVDFTTRGARLDEWVEVLRQCWTGQPVGFSGSHYVLPPDVYAYPTPMRDIPLLVGGTSKAALRRAANVGGWFALYRPEEDPVVRLTQDVVTLQESADACGRRFSDIRIVLSVDAPDRVTEHLGHLAALGVTDITIEVGTLEAAERNYALLADAAIAA